MLDALQSLILSKKAQKFPGAATVKNLLEAGDVYKDVLRSTGGDTREAYNMTELARAGRPVPGMEGLSQEQMAAINRIADTRDQPANAPLLAVYEGLKGTEQTTGLPVLSALGKAGVPRVTPAKAGVTTKASLLNLLSSTLGPLLGR